MLTTQYVYKVQGKTCLEPFTGEFDTVEQAREWYDKHASFHEARGRKLVLKKVFRLGKQNDKRYGKRSR